MKRIIVDYSKLTNEILDLLIEKYPDGYNYNDIISFKNSLGEYVNTIEVRTDEIIYLVKISSKLEEKMDNYQEDNLDEEFLLDELDFIDSD